MLNTIEYANADGTRTVYSFAQPIKYIDKNGVIQRVDSTLALSNKNNCWETTANWFSLSINNDISKGVTLSCDENSLTASPVLSRNGSAFSRKSTVSTTSKSLAFNSDNQEIEYATTNTGYYANITIAEGASFSLDISGDIVSADVDSFGATFVLKNGTSVSYSLTALCVGSQYTDFSNAQISVLPIDTNTYRVTYAVTIVSAQKLAPIQLIIEAMATAAENAARSSSTLSDSEVIPLSYYTDATAYSNYPSNNYGTAIRCLVGVDGTMGKSRSYFRFDLSHLSDIPYNRVLSAHYRIRELTGYDSSFQAVAYIVQQEWSETSIVWSDRPDCFDEKLATVNVEWGDPPAEGNRAYYDFYITSAVMAWLQGVPNRGIMVKSRVETDINCRAFASREYGSYIPRLTITYSTESQSMDNIGITDDLGFYETEYYIKNKHSMLYLTANGTASGASIVQKNWNGSSAQKWTIKPQGNGYYKLSPGNASQKVLDNCNKNNVNNTLMELSSSGFGASQEFKFIRNWDGSYQIVSRISSGLRGLCAYDNNSTNGGAICHRSHTTNWAKTDDWTLEPVSKGAAEVFCFNISQYYNINTAQYASQMVDALADMGYDATEFENEHHGYAYNMLSDDSVWVFTGHGGLGYVEFETGLITATKPSDEQTYRLSIIDKPHNALSKLDLVVFSSCGTGLDDSSNNTNLVGLTYQRGARFVIAHTDLLAMPDSDVWLQQFLINCSNGQTVYEAMDNADTYMYDTYGSSISFGNAVQRHVLGDNSLRIDR